MFLFDKLRNRKDLIKKIFSKFGYHLFRGGGG